MSMRAHAYTHRMKLSAVVCVQAVMASDFAMGRFCFLEKLLLVHGHWSYSRLARMMLYFFYKNMVSATDMSLPVQLRQETLH